MASSASGKPQRPILLLKDYLRDDLSSCSSSGFKSLPRRQCCLQRRSCSFSSSSSFCTSKSVLQRASDAVLNVIKSLQTPAPQRYPCSSFSKTRTRKPKKVLSRSFSRRLLSRNFWRRVPSKEARESCTFVSGASSASASDNNTCVETSVTCSLTATEDSTRIQDSVTTTTNSCSLTHSTREWPNEEKEQSSPVSVLDCPLFDDYDEIMSPFNFTACSGLEGAKHKHKQKSGQCNRMKPVALEKRISWSELQGNEPIHDPNGHSDMHDNNLEEKARDLVNHVKRSINPSSNCLRIEAENMLIDFFKQSIIDMDDSLMKRHLCKVVEDWGNYSGEEEMQCVAMELEVGLFTRLVNELLLDLATCMI